MGFFDRSLPVKSKDLAENADDQYILIDKIQQQSIQDASQLHNDLKPIAELLKTSPDLLQAALEPTDYDLYKAIREGRTKLVTALVERGSNVNFVDEHDENKSCLHLAARSSNPQLLRTLLAAKSKGLKLDPVCDRGLTPLMVAAVHGKLNNVNALAEAGADLEASIQTNRLALDPLLDLDQVITNGSTALILAAQHGHADVVTALLKHGADAFAETNHKFTAIHAATMAGSVTSVMAILEHSPEALNAVTDGTFKPLHYAAHFGFEDVARLLLDRGASLEAKKSLDMTPLLEAVWTEQYGMVCFLISRGADIEARTDEFNDDIFHFTPLMLAAKYNLVEITAALLHAGADQSATSDWGETARQIAEREDSHEVLALLGGPTDEDAEAESDDDDDAHA